MRRQALREMSTASTTKFRRVPGPEQFESTLNAKVSTCTDSFLSGNPGIYSQLVNMQIWAAAARRSAAALNRSHMLCLNLHKTATCLRRLRTFPPKPTIKASPEQALDGPSCHSDKLLHNRRCNRGDGSSQSDPGQSCCRCAPCQKTIDRANGTCQAIRCINTSK